MVRVRPLWLIRILVVILASATNVFAAPNNPIVFVTQPPWPYDFTTINATFGNHRASLDAAPRGGDLYIRYANGTLKNLTQAAGYGMSGFQGAQSIAVRDPSVHWDGAKVIFSMVVGAPTAQYQVNQYRWQLYEITGLGQSDTPVITKVPNQPEAFNNVSPTYASDDSIIFTSDRPRNGATHLYPQRDEYESSPTNTGLWKLTPQTGVLILLDHAPSGDFSPFVDSFGRVIFVRWDHLQRDQQNQCSNSSFQAFNYSSEAADAQALDTDAEVFPEARGACEQESGGNLDLHRFNHFLPWQINEDGTEMETINHIGRHELVDYLGKSFNDDPNVVEYYGQYTRTNQNSVENMFQLSEDPTTPGTYLGTHAPEFGTHASGQLFFFSAAPSTNADDIDIRYITHPDTANTDETPSASHIGLSRDPVSLSNELLVASHTESTLPDTNLGTTANPQSRYAYRLRTFTPQGNYFVPDTTLTSGIQETISFWNPDTLVSFSNVTMWELQPRELIARPRPPARQPALPAPEESIFADVGVAVEDLQEFLRDNELALIVSRNVTVRDDLDRQQPTNLRVLNTQTSTVPRSGKVYDIAHFQIFQGDQVRAYAGGSATQGRRVLAQPMHSVTDNIENPDGPPGSVAIAADGSVAAFVPARRALTYQLTDAAGEGVVRERLWLTFQPGEIRVCASCHGLNKNDHLGNTEPTNPPEALRSLLEAWSGSAPSAPTFDLSTRARVRAGAKVRLDISGNERAANRSVQIAARVGRKNCGILATVTTDDSSAGRLSVKTPRTSRRSKIRFALAYQDSERDHAQVTLLPAAVRDSQSTAPLSPKRMCRALKKAAQK